MICKKQFLFVIYILKTGSGGYRYPTDTRMRIRIQKNFRTDTDTDAKNFQSGYGYEYGYNFCRFYGSVDKVKRYPPLQALFSKSKGGYLLAILHFRLHCEFKLGRNICAQSQLRHFYHLIILLYFSCILIFPTCACALLICSIDLFSVQGAILSQKNKKSFDQKCLTSVDFPRYQF